MLIMILLMILAILIILVVLLARTGASARDEQTEIMLEELKAAGISMGTIRFSIGLEDADDIIEEFKYALDQL